MGSHTPAPWWFKGKALYSAGSSVSVVALPQVMVGGKIISSNALSFQWSINDSPMPQSSGLGRSSITFKGSQLRAAETADVNVQFGGVTVAQGRIVITASKPQAMLYVHDPLRGTLFDQALQNQVSLTATEFTVEAAPFYFANASIKNGSVPFAWTLNSEEATGPQTSQGLITLRQSGSGAGQANLGVTLQNVESDKYVQTAKNNLTILFGGSTGSLFSAFFGL